MKIDIKKIIISCFILSLVLMIYSGEQSKVTLFPEVHKIDDTLFVGKVNDTFYVAMEQINNNNIDNWMDYANRQAATAEMNLSYRTTADGVLHFAKVLKYYKQNIIDSKNELWIAYTSSEPIKEKASFVYNNNKTTKPIIDMFVSVTTSPTAKLISFMGISRSWETALKFQQNGIKPNSQSLSLLSFASKVMKIRDSEKIYVLFAPVTIIRNLLLTNLPNAVFIGDRTMVNEYKEKVNNLEHMLKQYRESDDITIFTPMLTRYQLKKRNETLEKRKTRLLKNINERLQSAKDTLTFLEGFTQRIITTKTDQQKDKYIILGAHDQILFNFDETNPTYQWIFTAAFQPFGYHIYLILVDLKSLADIGSLVPFTPTNCI